VDAYNKYIFVVCICISKYKDSYWIYVTKGEIIDKKTERIMHFIDIKSKGLQDILRSVL